MQHTTARYAIVCCLSLRLQDDLRRTCSEINCAALESPFKNSHSHSGVPKFILITILNFKFFHRENCIAKMQVSYIASRREVAL